LNNTQIFDDGKYDPISESLEKSFQCQGFRTIKKLIIHLGLVER